MRRLLCDEKYIFELVKKKKVFCYGIGAYFNNKIYSVNSKYNSLLSNIDYFVDKKEQQLLVDGELVKTIPLEKTQDFIDNNSLFIISVENYLEEIENKLLSYYKNDDVLCFILSQDFRNYDTKLLEENMNNASDREIIPKTIHWCWFGNAKYPELVERCLESWKKYASEYKIILWNENNFNLNENRYVKEAYEAKKYAFVSDYVRLWAIEKYGGVYLDSDVELVGSINQFLSHKAFSGFESQETIPTGIMGGEQHSRWFKHLLKYYENRSFYIDGMPDCTANILPITNITSKEYDVKLYEGFVDLGDVVLYPREVFCPKQWDTGEILITDKTKCIHHFAGSWKKQEK